MQPDDTSLINILSSSPMQYVIPRFQREYTWGKDAKLIRVKQLWEDIKQAHLTQRPHFTGTIVFTVDNYGNDTCQCRYLIDGQQRMITISLMIKAFSLHVSKDTKKVIESYLVNVVDSVYGSNLKILPSEDDRKAYKAIINNKGNVSETHLNTPVGKAYSYFEKQLQMVKSKPELFTIDELYNSAVKYIHVVRIVIDNQEDPSEIFKSLNDNSSPLSKLDLIRNHILMKLKVDADKKDWQKKFYDDCWHPFEESLSELDPNKKPEKVFEDFLRCYFIKNGKKVSYSMIYETMKEKIRDFVSKSTDSSGVVVQERLYDTLEQFISELNEDFTNYKVICGSPKKKVGKQNSLIIRQCMYQLSSLGVKTHSWYVLMLLSEFDKGTIDEDELTACIRMVDSYFIRRSIQGGLSYNSVEKMFVDLCSKVVVRPEMLYNELKKYPNDSRVWPNDDFIKDRLSKDLYDPDAKNTLALIILQQLDMKIAGRWVDYSRETEIEHICPQTRSDEWAKHYSKEEYDSMFESRHCLGNLTLSDYNQIHAQKLYSVKRDEYAEKVTCPITRRIAKNYGEWTLSTFYERSEELIDDFLDEWPYEYQSFLSKPKKKK